MGRLAAALAIAALATPLSDADAALTAPGPGADAVTSTPHVAPRCRPRPGERRVARGAALDVLYLWRGTADDERIRRWQACSRQTGRRTTLGFERVGVLNMDAYDLSHFRIAGRRIAWVTFRGPRFGPYETTISVRRFPGGTRSTVVPLERGDDLRIPALVLSSDGRAAFLSRSYFAGGDVLRVLGTDGVARRFDGGVLNAIDTVSLRAGLLAWEHAGVRRTRPLPAGPDPCRLKPGEQPIDATEQAVAYYVGGGVAQACLREVGRRIALPGGGRVALAGRYAIVVGYVTGAEVHVIDLGTGAPAQPPRALTGPEDTVVPLPDGRLVILDAARGGPLLLRDRDGTETVIDPGPSISLLILDDGVLHYSAGREQRAVRLAPPSSIAR